MDEERSTLTRLLQSKSRNARLVGFAIALFLFVPSVCRVAGNLNLTIWERIEQLSLAAAQTLFTVGIAAIPPESLADSRSSSDSDSTPAKTVAAAPPEPPTDLDSTSTPIQEN